jgi:hypothetical protein
MNRALENRTNKQDSSNRFIASNIHNCFDRTSTTPSNLDTRLIEQVQHGGRKTLRSSQFAILRRICDCDTVHPHELILKTSPVVLGRDRKLCDYVLDDPIYPKNLSRAHARFEYHAEQPSGLNTSKDATGFWTIKDLDSLNGFFVNGVKLQSATLRFGDTILLGSGGTHTTGERRTAPPHDKALIFRLDCWASIHSGHRHTNPAPISPRSCTQRDGKRQRSCMRDAPTDTSLRAAAGDSAPHARDAASAHSTTAPPHVIAGRDLNLPPPPPRASPSGAAENTGRRPPPLTNGLLAHVDAELPSAVSAPSAAAATAAAAADTRPPPADSAPPPALPPAPPVANSVPAAAGAGAMADAAPDLEEECTCAICRGLFVGAAALGCAHAFCEECVAEWLRCAHGGRETETETESGVG